MSENKVHAQRWWRVLPLLFLMYAIANIDRNNIGFGFAGMEEDLGIGATYAGLAAGIFFFGYMILQVPGGHLAKKWSAKKFIAWSLFAWGIAATSMGFVNSLPMLLIVRFLVGVTEGGVWTATLILISKWFPLKERARANAIFIMCTPFAAIIMSPMSGFLLDQFDWRGMFIIQGLLPFIFLPFWLWLLAEKPNEAKWISKEERDYLEKTIAEEQQDEKGVTVSFREVFKNKSFWLLMGFYFLIQMGFYGFSLWLPTITKQLSGGSDTLVGLLTALPWLASIVGLILFPRYSDKHEKRKGPIALSVGGGATFLLLSALLGNVNTTLSFICLILCMGFLLGYLGIFWVIPPKILPDRLVGASLGVINIAGALGGFLGPFLVGYIASLTGVAMSGMFFLVAALYIATFLILIVKDEKQQIKSREIITGYSDVKEGI
ncbi:MFS transporter [Bacillus sp. V2I10]|uniref:MFS transporter n=1 Tax=Bacillus sp. V2I10 TaxID=3042276 RepID=UPI002783C6E5|nr:MFS transporter [Bacillus sp. V2I10]MDQ0857857.1 sugar phosphate permease [Bacillus sp. V2I10]